MSCAFTRAAVEVGRAIELRSNGGVKDYVFASKKEIAFCTGNVTSIKRRSRFLSVFDTGMFLLVAEKQPFHTGSGDEILGIGN